MHWCGDETAALAGALSSVGLCWAWLKHKVRGWRERRAQQTMEKARKRYGWGPVTQEEFERVINKQVGRDLLAEEVARYRQEETAAAVAIQLAQRPRRGPTDMEQVAAIMKGKKP